MQVNIYSYQNLYRSIYLKELISYDVNFLEYNRRVIQSYIALLTRHPDTNLCLVDSLLIYFSLNKIRSSGLEEGRIANISSTYIFGLLHAYSDNKFISMFEYLKENKADKFILNILNMVLRENEVNINPLTVVRVEKILAIHKKVCGGSSI